MKFRLAMRNMGLLQKMTMVSMVSNVVLSVSVFYAFIALNNTHERLVIIPPHLDSKAEIAWNSANKNYLQSFGFYVANLVGNIQPSTAGIILEATSAFMEPRIYNEFRRQAIDIINDPVFKQTKSSTFFSPRSIVFEKETSKVFVLGELETKSVNSDLRKKVVYEIGIVIREGRPWVTHFTSYDGDKPKTIHWYLKNQMELPEHAVPGSAERWQNSEENIDSVSGDFTAESAPDLDIMNTESKPID